MKNQTDPGKQFESELRAVLEKTTFEIPEALKADGFRVMKLLPIRTLGCDAGTFRSLVDKLEVEGKTDFNLFEVSFLLNGFNLVSAKDFGFETQTYANMILEVEKTMDRWNKIVDPIKTKIANKIKTRMNLGQPSSGRMVNPNLRIKK